MSALEELEKSRNWNSEEISQALLEFSFEMRLNYIPKR